MAFESSPGQNPLTMSDLDQLSDEQVAAIGEQLFSLIMSNPSQAPRRMPQRPAPQRRLPPPQRPQMQRPQMQQQMQRPQMRQGMPPKIPRGQGNMVKRVLQNRSQPQQPLPNPSMMRQQMPPQMVPPQYQQFPIYQPLSQPMGVPTGPFMAMNPHEMYR